MGDVLNYLQSEYSDLWGERTLHLLSVESLDDEFFNNLDDVLIRICCGDVKRDLSAVKRKALKLINKGGNYKKGVFSEFFLIVYMLSQGFKQEFLFFNLEESSFKKGLDGLYTKDGEFYLFESKSGDKKTKTGVDQFFSYKLKLALNGIEASTTGRNENTWENAVNHAKLTNIEDDLLNRMLLLADNLLLGKLNEFEKKNFNVIPSSTLFFDNCDDEWSETKYSNLAFKDTNYLNNLENEYKTITIICLGNRSLKNNIKLFKEYLKR